MGHLGRRVHRVLQELRDAPEVQHFDLEADLLQRRAQDLRLLVVVQLRPPV